MDRKDQITLVNSWLKDISAALDIELLMNDEGICTFQVGEEMIVIEISSDFPMVHFYSPLQSLPLEDKETTISLLVRALELNAFQILTRGGAIASAPGGGFLIFCYSLPIEGTDAEKFSTMLNAFFEILPEIKHLLSQSPSGDLKMEKDVPPLGSIKT